MCEHDIHAHVLLRTRTSALHCCALACRAQLLTHAARVAESSCAGCVQAISPQLPGLTAAGFDVQCLYMPLADRSSWPELTANAIRLLRELLATSPHQQVAHNAAMFPAAWIESFFARCKGFDTLCMTRHQWHIDVLHILNLVVGSMVICRLLGLADLEAQLLALSWRLDSC